MKNTTGRLRKLKRQEVECLRDRFVASFKPGDMQDQIYDPALQVSTRVDLPLGELLNAEMSELIRAWRLMTCAFILGKITPLHQFSAQGIEGLMTIENVPLCMALLASIKTGLYRIAIFVPHGWTCDLLQGVSGIEEDKIEQPGKDYSLFDA